jgi:hypothetical protein
MSKSKGNMSNVAKMLNRNSLVFIFKKVIFLKKKLILINFFLVFLNYFNMLKLKIILKHKKILF